MKKVILDGLSIVPYYNYYLIRELNKIDSECSIMITTFVKDRSITNNMENKLKCLDFNKRFNLKESKITKSINLLEYVVNLNIITFMIKIKKIDLVHIQWVPLIQLLNWDYFEANFIKKWKKYGAKIVYTVHNVLPHDSEEKFFKAYYEIYNIVDELICHTEKTSLELQQKFNIDKKKINIIPHGPLFDYKDKRNKQEARENLELPDKKTVVILGFLRPYKGIEFLLSAWRRVVNTLGNEVNLIIAGEGKSDYKEIILKKIKEEGLKGNVITKFGFIKTEDLLDYHYAADIVVFPYKNIDQSGALYTAMATESPIIATNVGGFREVIKDNENGYLVEFNNVEELSNKIVDLLMNDEKKEKFTKNNLDLLINKYSWSSIANETIKVYNKQKEI